MLDWSPAPAPASCALYLFTSQFTATLHSATVLLLGTVLYYVIVKSTRLLHLALNEPHANCNKNGPTTDFLYKD